MSEPESHEMTIARIVSDFAVWGLGRVLGEPTDHDDNSEPAMVDVLFDQAEPPVALEVTSIVDGDFVATAVAADRSVERLSEYAEHLGVGRWVINLAAGAHLNTIEQALRDLMSDPDLLSAFSKPNGLRAGLPSGVMSMYLDADGPSGADLGTWGQTGATPLQSISADLDDAIVQNKTKLGAAIGYEKHLAVDVVEMRASDPGRSPPPSLPEQIDFLWVVRRWVSPSRSRPVVWLTDGGPWKVNGAPHEAV
jgi:hypothetical protein